MSFVFMFSVLSFLCFLAEKSLHKKTEEIFVVSIFSVIIFLFPFYCLNILIIGKILIYILLFVLTCFFAGKWLKDLKNIRPAAIVSPGICVIGIVSIFYILYLHDNKIELWDELRLWGAVSKAMHATDALQIGKESAIYPIMQSYPPGMPLLVYFFTGLSDNFAEYQVFYVYAFFFGALLFPIAKDIKWTYWPFVLPVAVLIIVAPCIFTSHGGDLGWFYESLFIDPLLGAAAGYVFYLASSCPFSSGFSKYRFAVALAVLALLKDSGIVFAAMAAINAIAHEVFSRKTLKKSDLLHMSATIMPMLLYTGIWKYILEVYEVSTVSSSHLDITNLSADTFICLWNKLLSTPMLQIYSIELSFIPCFAVLLIGGLLAHGLLRGKDGKQLYLTTGVMMLTSVAFLVGNVIAFGEELPSFQRYASSLLTCFLVFFVLTVIPELIKKLQETNMSLWGGIILSGVLCSIVIRLSCTELIQLIVFAFALLVPAFVCFMPSVRKKQEICKILLLLALSAFLTERTYYFMRDWERQKLKIPGEEYIQTREVVSDIQNNKANINKNDVKYYLLISDDMREKARLHHRIYFELLGTGNTIQNFFNDTNIYSTEYIAQEIPVKWEQEEVRKITEKWKSKLLEEGYDYIYVLSLNDFTRDVLYNCGIPDAEKGSILKIIPIQGTAKLEYVD